MKTYLHLCAQPECNWLNIYLNEKHTEPVQKPETHISCLINFSFQFYSFLYN
jgi:hypothetical protein